MEQKIVNIIEDKAGKQLVRMSETKAKSYKAMLYAGVRVTLDEVTLKQVAKEIGYSSISAISKLIHKWNDKVTEGDVVIHRIVAAYNKIHNRKYKIPKKIALQPEETEDAKMEAMSEITLEKVEKELHINTAEADKPKGRWCLGFWLSKEDDIRERVARRSAILFMQKYGKGRQPRMNGEYYSPGENPNKPSDCAEWLPLDTAAMYCGCKATLIEKAGQNEEIRRRVYKRNKSRNYYEYLISDLDQFMKRYGMI